MQVGPYVPQASAPGKLDERAAVTLRGSMESGGQMLPAGARGTVVATVNGGLAYEVEIFQPIHATATVPRLDLVV